MFHGLRHGCLFHFRLVLGAKRSARSCQNNPLHFFTSLASQTLMHCALCSESTGKSSAPGGFGSARHQFAGDHQRLFIRTELRAYLLRALVGSGTNPTAPTVPLTTQSACGCVATSTKPCSPDDDPWKINIPLKQKLTKFVLAAISLSTETSSGRCEAI